MRHRFALRALAIQFVRFGCVGCCGLVVDTATVYALRLPVGLYAAGLVSYFAGATVTFLLNRCWTFRGCGEGTLLRQWLMFLSANLLGFLLNRGAYACLIAVSAAARSQPVIATAAGAACGMVSNFWLSRRLVFGQGRIAKAVPSPALPPNGAAP